MKTVHFWRTPLNPAYFAMFPELEYDSWLALGGGPGSPIELQTVGLYFFTDFEEGANVLVNTVVVRFIIRTGWKRCRSSKTGSSCLVSSLRAALFQLNTTCSSAMR